MALAEDRRRDIARGLGVSLAGVHGEVKADENSTEPQERPGR